MGRKQSKPARRPRRGWGTWKSMVLVASVGFTAYLNSLDNDFVYDDRFVVEESAAVQELDWRALGGSSYWGDLVEAGLYRPATSVSFGVNRAVLGADATGFHLINNLLHGATSALVSWLAVLLGASPSVSLAAGLLFAVHPVHTEAVNAIVGRADIMALLFSMAALGVFIQVRRPGASSPLAGLSIFLLFLLGLLSKESAAFALPLFLLYDVCFHIRVGWRAYLPLGASLGVYVVFRYLALDGLGVTGRHIGVLDNPAAHATWGERMLTAPVIIGKYLQLLFTPVTLSADYSFNQFPLARSFLDWRVVTGTVALLMLTVGAAFAWKRKSSLAVFAIGALLLPMLGLIHLLLPLGTLLAERLSYLPSLGFCLLAGVGYGVLRSRRRRLADSVLLGVLLVGASVTLARNEDWQDNEALFRRTVETAPASARSHFLLGTALFEKEAFEEATASFRRGLKIAPGHAQALVSLGQSLASARRFGEAEEVLREAVMKDHSARLALGLVLYKAGRLEEAVDVLGRFIEAEPDGEEGRLALSRAGLGAGRERARRSDWVEAERFFRRSYEALPGAEAANQLGVVRAIQGDYDVAETWHRRALEHEPTSAEATSYLGVLEERRGDRSGAKALYREALALDPDWVPALLNLGSIEMQEGDLAAAVERYRRAARLDPQSYEAHNSLGIALARMGRPREAGEAFRRAMTLNPDLPAARENLAALESES